MGAGFDVDAFIFENLVYDRVSSPEDPRALPSGLDVMAVLGSAAAQEELNRRGDFEFQNYPEQLSLLQDTVADQTTEAWLSDAYGTWMFAISDQLSNESLSYPPYMRTPVWGYRVLDGGLGGWVSWRQDAPVQPLAVPEPNLEDKPLSPAAPCYVEPLPQVYYRLAYLAGALVDGLEQRGMLAENPDPLGLDQLAGDMLDLSDRLGRLGDIAVKELEGVPLDGSDCALVEAPLGSIEARWMGYQLQMTQGQEPGLESMAVSSISKVWQSGDQTLQAGLGRINRIYVLIPMDGEVAIAQGGVFSYYEFIQPGEDELSQEAWRLAVSAGVPESPAWTQRTVLPNGSPVDSLAFRVGDVYRLTLAAGQLGLRATPDPSARYQHRLSVGDYVTIVEGPIQAGGSTWWKFEHIAEEGDMIEGWAVGNEEWFERAWGQ